MPIEDPKTYGEHYWRNQVDAQKLYDDDVEAETSSYIRNMFESLGIRDVLPAAFGKYVDQMTSQNSFAWGAILARFGSEMADSVLSQTLTHALKDFNYMMAEKFHDERIDAQTACTLYQRKNIDSKFWATRMLSQGYSLAEGIHAYGASLPYPSVPDLMLWGRYHGDPYNTRSQVWKKFDVPADDYEMWEWLTYQRLTTQQVHTLYRRGIITHSQLDNELARIGWMDGDEQLIKSIYWTMPNAMLLVQGDLMQGKPNAEILKDISIADINPKYAATYYDAVLTKPSSQDIIAYQLRRDPDLSGLDRELRKIGIHEDYRTLYRELAYQIPPVADIITMAVREAFTPEIAAKFGQYQDYPKALETWGIKKGLSPEWTQRYWAAHWSLPSAQQGFEMLHRGVIDSSELDMLLRALDVMPFWREKLTRIAYKRLTRIDIRRMFDRGVLDETQVYTAYLELGYNERDAKRMSDFTLKQVLATQSKFTSRDVISAYSKYMITKSEARSLLLSIGVRSENISYIISSADYKREWALTEDRITAIRNLYKKQVYDDNAARAELLKLNLPAEQVNVLMEQWYIDERDKPPRFWTTAQTLSFIQDGLITKERGESELYRLGYDAEHVTVYMESVA